VADCQQGSSPVGATKLFLLMFDGFVFEDCCADGGERIARSVKSGRF
jgi:hypothetical protein